MFEYVNPLFLMMGALVLFVLFGLVIIELDENRKKGRDNIGARVTATVFIMLALMFWDASDTKKSLINNKADFNRGIALECDTGFNTYLVQKSTGWQLSKESFLKNDTLISLKNCKPRDKGE